jgi:hypothetical protein
LAANIVRTNQAWLRAGNSGTVSGTDFVGTTDSPAIESKVNNGRALRLDRADSTDVDSSSIANDEFLARASGRFAFMNGNVGIGTNNSGEKLEVTGPDGLVFVLPPSLALLHRQDQKSVWFVFKLAPIT